MIFPAIGWRMWFTLGMARHPNMPNGENCSLAELEVADKAAPRQRGGTAISVVRDCFGLDALAMTTIGNVVFFMANWYHACK